MEMTGLFQDVRYALRQLRKSPGFTAVAVLTLGLGIGLNSAIFTLFDALTLRPLPISDPDAVVNVDLWETDFPTLCGRGTFWREFERGCRNC